MSEREIIDIVSIGPTKRMTYSSKLRHALGVEAPCKLVVEYNENREIVIRKNEVK